MELLVNSVQDISAICSGCFNDLLPENIDLRNVSVNLNEEDFERIKKLIQNTPKR